MIIIKSQREINLMREAGRIVAQVFDELEKFIVPGVTTKQISQKAEKIIRDAGAISASKGYEGFPEAICTSVNDVIVHGIPNNTKLKEGDIVRIVEARPTSKDKRWALAEVVEKAR